MPMRELSPEVGDGLIFQAAVSTDHGMLMTTFQPVIDAVAQTRVRELDHEVEKEKQTVDVCRDVCKTLAVPFTRTPGLVGRVASCP